MTGWGQAGPKATHLECCSTLGLFLLGEDYWERRVSELSGGEKVEIVIYAGALHDFDHPRLEVKERSDIAFSATGTGKATVGTNPEAREDAIKRVRAFLSGL